MFYVYVLLDKNRNFYTGSCRDLRNRIAQHKNGEVFSTKSKIPVTLIYYESCINNFDAIKREKYLKSGPGKKYLKNRLKNFFKGLGPVRSLVIKQNRL